MKTKHVVQEKLGNALILLDSSIKALDYKTISAAELMAKLKNAKKMVEDADQLIDTESDQF